MTSLTSKLVIAFSLTAVGGCAISAAPISAQVVDADTSQPIAGVVVVAYWELHRGSFTGDALPCGVAGVEEAVTDQDGRFHTPGWGPITSTCDMRMGNPQLIFFKPGYVPQDENNNPMDPRKTVSVSRSDWDGKIIKLAKNTDTDLREPTSHYVIEFEDMNSSRLGFVVNYPGECYWKKIPNMLRAVVTQDQMIHEAGNNEQGSIAAALIRNDKYYQSIAPQCGSPKAFIEGLEK